MRQAPSLQLEHVKKLHKILDSDCNITDRLGAGCFLVCIYGRARWSDIRFISYVELDKQRNGHMTLFTSEHKSSSVGLRREQFLPLVVPWEGVTQKSWVENFLQVYADAGLDIMKRPLGPLLPAPKPNGEFCKRFLSTGEAAVWLRALLSGTTDSEQFRSHSLKATMLVWSAKAGFDRETRSVLGHRCSSLNGSEVVYSRHLQTRALRKLSMMLRRIRIGLGIEEECMVELGIPSTPAPFTPLVGLRTPVPVARVPQTPLPAPSGEPEVVAEPMAEVAEVMNQLEDVQSVKEEMLDDAEASAAAEQLTLFPIEMVENGAIQIDSSSGSDSEESSSGYSSSDSSEPRARPSAAAYREEVPQDKVFFKHCKSHILHSAPKGECVTDCGVKVSSNFNDLYMSGFPNVCGVFQRIRTASELETICWGPWMQQSRGTSVSAPKGCARISKEIKAKVLKLPET